jgi:hypothetical protein
VIRGRRSTRVGLGAPCGPAAAIVLVAAIGGAGAGCHRDGGAPVGGVPAAGGAPAPRRPVARREPAFSHPLLAGATTEVTHEDCSRPALVTVANRLLAIEAKADPAATRGGPKHPSESCPSPVAEETEKIVRGELFTRVGGCVARDGPLDPQWDMVNSAVLSLGVCLDCRRGRDEQATQCRRARDVLLRAAKKTPR